MKYVRPFTEATFDFEKDVDFIYSNFIEKELKDILSKDIELLKVIDSVNEPYFLNKTSSEIFQSEICRKAHKQRYLNIFISISDVAGKYDSTDRVMEFYILRKAIIDSILNDQEASYFSSEQFIKKMLTFELSHWIARSVYQETFPVIEAFHQTIEEYLQKKMLFNLDAVFPEMDLHIQMIRDAKDNYIGRWDWINFEDLLKLVPLLQEKKLALQDRDKQLEWQNSLLKEMEKNNLLSLNMKINSSGYRGRSRGICW